MLITLRLLIIPKHAMYFFMCFLSITTSHKQCDQFNGKALCKEINRLDIFKFLLDIFKFLLDILNKY